MTLAMIFAAVWGALELAFVGTLTRTIRLRTALLGVAAGFYISAPLAFVVQRYWIQAWATVTTGDARGITYLAGYTTDPAIEEVLKILPLVAVLLLPRVRERWSLTDCVILGGAAGAGFMIAESLLAFGSVPHKAMGSDNGWWLATNISYPTVPGFMSILRSWLPPSVESGEVWFPGVPGRPWVAVHTAWSALGGFAVVSGPVIEVCRSPM